MLYTSLLPDLAAGAVEPRHVVVPLRQMAPHASGTRVVLVAIEPAREGAPPRNEPVTPATPLAAPPPVALFSRPCGPRNPSRPKLSISRRAKCRDESSPSSVSGPVLRRSRRRVLRRAGPAARRRERPPRGG
jgi:hypothetical protein